MAATVEGGEVARVEIHETSLSGDCRHSTHAVLLRSNPPLPAASIGNHQHTIATMIIDRGFILTPVLVELVIARQGFARGLGITRFWAILGPILQIPADRQFTPAAPDCARHWATASTRLHSSFSHSNSLLPCLSCLVASFPASLVYLPPCLLETQYYPSLLLSSW